MLTDEQREIIPQSLENLYEEFTQYVINDIARRVQKTSRLTETAELMVTAMQEQGFSPAEIQKSVMKKLNADKKFQAEIARNTLEYKKSIQKKINELLYKATLEADNTLDEAANMSFNNNLKIWTKAGKGLNKPNNLSQMVNAIKKQTNGTLRNITKTKGLAIRDGAFAIDITNAYRHELDLALIKTTSGVSTYQQAASDCIKKIAQSGVSTITYKRTDKGGIVRKRIEQIDAAARRAILTSSSQLAGEISMQNCIDDEVEYVEVSSHSGARPEHEAWQGKVYKINGSDENYDNFYKSTGYGEITGLCGINCAHTFYPFFPGISTPNPPHEESPPKTINGKTYTEYEATQSQRKMEREIRALKRELIAKKETGSSESDIKKLNSKIKQKRNEYKDFSEKAGLRAKLERTQIQGK